MDSPNDALRTTLESLLRRGASHDELRAALVAFKERGGLQQDAVEILYALRAWAPDEATEDLVLDTLDFATGWCRAEIRVWGTEG
ncbi:MAG: hypothetical protein AAF799_36035 [Myxococcota bacterium]